MVRAARVLVSARFLRMGQERTAPAQTQMVRTETGPFRPNRQPGQVHRVLARAVCRHRCPALRQLGMSVRLQGPSNRLGWALVDEVRASRVPRGRSARRVVYRCLWSLRRCKPRRVKNPRRGVLLVPLNLAMELTVPEPLRLAPAKGLMRRRQYRVRRRHSGADLRLRQRQRRRPHRRPALARGRFRPCHQLFPAATVRRLAGHP